MKFFDLDSDAFLLIGFLLVIFLVTMVKLILRRKSSAKITNLGSDDSKSVVLRRVVEVEDKIVDESTDAVDIFEKNQLPPLIKGQVEEDGGNEGKKNTTPESVSRASSLTFWDSCSSCVSTEVSSEQEDVLKGPWNSDPELFLNLSQNLITTRKWERIDGAWTPLNIVKAPGRTEESRASLKLNGLEDEGKGKHEVVQKWIDNLGSKEIEAFHGPLDFYWETRGEEEKSNGREIMRVKSSSKPALRNSVGPALNSCMSEEETDDSSGHVQLVEVKLNEGVNGMKHGKRGANSSIQSLDEESSGRGDLVKRLRLKNNYYY